MQINSGIYKIKIERYFYIGSSKNINNRISVHLYHLRKKNHTNSKMQNVFNKYGDKHFSFEILELVDESNLLICEQKYLNETFILPESLNLALSVDCPMRGKKHSKETREKISRNRKGILHSEATKQKISKNNSKFWEGKERKELGEKFKGHSVTNETREKIRKSLVNRPLSEKTKNKMKGRIPWNKGLTRTTDIRVDNYNKRRMENLKNASDNETNG